MKKFGMLLLGLSLVGFTVGCGGTADDTEPVDPAPPADTTTDPATDEAAGDDTIGDPDVEETTTE